MGIDFLDIIIRVEKRFRVRLDPREFEPHARDRKPCDMTVAELTRELERALEKRRAASPEASKGPIREPMRRIIAEALGIKVGAVRPEAWLIKDLGMT